MPLNMMLVDTLFLRHQMLALETKPYTQRRTISWQFTSRDARSKLQDLYPIKET